jgi:hypothetical protein
MEPRTVIASRPRVSRTPLGDVVTVRKVVEDNGCVWESVTLECPLETVEPGQTWPEHTSGIVTVDGCDYNARGYPRPERKQ